MPVPRTLCSPQGLCGNAKGLSAGFMALQTAAAEARHRDIKPVVLSDPLEGESRGVATVLEIARAVMPHGCPMRPPCVLLSGGEMTVATRGVSSGGRNTEFLLALLSSVAGAKDRISAIACDTDGTDGLKGRRLVRQANGARSGRARLEPHAFLSRNDAYSFFAATAT